MKYNAKKRPCQLLLTQPHGEKCYDADTSQQHMTQFFKMVPKSQGNGNFSLLIIHLIAFYLCRTFAFPLFNSEVVHNSGIIIRSVDSCP